MFANNAFSFILSDDLSLRADVEGFSLFGFNGILVFELVFVVPVGYYLIITFL